jgi:hypothetical protein
MRSLETPVTGKRLEEEEDESHTRSETMDITAADEAAAKN